MAPFLADKTLIQQGYLGSEPFVIQQKGGFDPVVLLVADGGYKGYGNIITAGRKIVEERPDVVQRFVDASIEGWYSFLYEDPEPANKLIRSANPEMTDALLAYGRENDEGPWHRRFRRCAHFGHWRHDEGEME